MTRRYEQMLRAAPLVAGQSHIVGEGVIHRPDGLPFWMLHLTREGTAWWAPREGAAFDSVAGDLVLVGPDVAQRYGVRGGAEWSTLWFVFEGLPHVERWLPSWPSLGARHYKLSLAGFTQEHRAAVETLLIDAHRYATSGLPNDRWLGLNALEGALIWIDGASPMSVAARVDPRLRRVIDHIFAHLNEPLTLDRLASIAMLSVPQLGRLFKSTFHQSPMHFVEATRIARAKELLELTPLHVHAIAWDVGFASPYYFSSRFRRHVGESPSQYRRRVSS